jgi:hypothetical protein
VKSSDGYMRVEALLGVKNYYMSGGREMDKT